MKLIFLVEEDSMKALLEILLPKVLSTSTSYMIIGHKGCGDLKKSIPVKLKSWQSQVVKFVIIHDQDKKECVALKKSLAELCSPYHREVLIRIVCHELEAWYLGDLEAVGLAYNKNFSALKNKKNTCLPMQYQTPKRS